MQRFELKDILSLTAFPFDSGELSTTQSLMQTWIMALSRRNIALIIAPKASAEGACILKEVGYYGACMMGYYD